MQQQSMRIFQVGPVQSILSFTRECIFNKKK